MRRQQQPLTEENRRLVLRVMEIFFSKQGKIPTVHPVSKINSMVQTNGSYSCLPHNKLKSRVEENDDAGESDDKDILKIFR